MHLIGIAFLVVIMIVFARQIVATMIGIVVIVVPLTMVVALIAGTIFLGQHASEKATATATVSEPSFEADFNDGSKRQYPIVGESYGGLTYKGGNPEDPKSWSR